MHVIRLCVWVTLMDTFVGIFVDLMGFMEGMAEVRGMLLEFCLEKELCVSNTWFKREEKRKVPF